MNKKLIVLLISSVFCLELLAQQPAWTDYYERNKMYPESEFLVGYMSGVNTKNAEPGELKSEYEMLAKDKLIQSIQVEIEANKSLNISNKNGKSSEEFLSKSVSFSSANVNGLNAYSFYDRKKKEVFAIAYANKKELTFYYRNLISSGKGEIKQKLIEGRKYAEKGNKEDALRSFYEAMPLLKDIDEARVLLIALNRKMYSDIDIDEINDLKIELINEIDKLIKPEELTLSEAAYFAAYGIYLQIGAKSKQFYISDFGYENTGLSSKFSKKWSSEFSSALVKAAKYNVAEKKLYNTYVIDGNYWKEGNFLKLNISVWEGNKIIAVSKASILLSLLENEKIIYIPPQIDKMIELKEYSIGLESFPQLIKIGTPAALPIVVKANNDMDGEKLPVQGLPLIVSGIETGNLLCKTSTNDKGIGECFLPAIETTKKKLAIKITLDIEKYFNVHENSIYYGIAKLQNPIKEIVTYIDVAKPTICIESSEKIYGRDMSIKTLEPSVKEVFAEKSYNFVDNPQEADLIIKINANTTTGTKYQGILFAYLDANISIIDASTGEEIGKTHLDQIKGGGANQDKAAKKAYLIGSKKVMEYIDQNF